MVLVTAAASLLCCAPPEMHIYAPAGCSITGYAGCSIRCPGHPIPDAYMEFRQSDQPQQGPDETDSERDEVPHHDPEDEES